MTLGEVNDSDADLLEQLPGEPTGLSLAEWADGLLDDRSPAAKGKVRAALDRIVERWKDCGAPSMSACATMISVATRPARRLLGWVQITRRSSP